MYFAQFYDYALTYDKKYGEQTLIPACGTDAVMPLDGRMSFDNMIKMIMNSEGGFKKYPAFKIMKSPTKRYSDGKPVTGKIFIIRGEDNE